MPRTVAFREALNEAMAEEMEKDDRIFLMGEEVGHYDGASKVSKGLLDKYGDHVLTTIDDDPGLAFRRLGLNPQRAKEATKSWNELRSTRAFVRVAGGGEIGA